MKRVHGASELLGTDWAFPWTAKNADARWAPASDPALEAGRAPAEGPEMVADPDPATGPAAGTCTGAGSGSTEGSGAGLAAGGGAGVTAAGTPGPGQSPAEPCPNSFGRILSPQSAAAAGPL